MKSFCKLLALMMVSVMAMSLFAACDSSADDAEDIKNVVESYFDAVEEYDFDKAEKYVDEDSDWWKESEDVRSGDEFEELGADMAKQLGLDESYAAKFSGLHEEFYKKGVAAQEIVEIGEAEISEDGKSAKVDYTVEALDEDALEEAFSNEKLNEIADEMYGDRKLSGEQLNEAKFAVRKEMFERAETDIKTQKKEKTVELELIDDEWKITEIDD